PRRCSLRCEQHPLGRVETARSSRVARRPLLLDPQQQGVRITVVSDFTHVLGVSGRLALRPQLTAAARIVGRAACLECVTHRLMVHPCHRQHVAGRMIHHYDADQPVCIECPTTHSQSYRTSLPSGRIACFTSASVNTAKWNTPAANTASAPAFTAGAKCPTAPAPPLAITGTVTAAHTALMSSRSKPSRVPSASI